MRELDTKAKVAMGQGVASQFGTSVARDKTRAEAQKLEAEATAAAASAAMEEFLSAQVCYYFPRVGLGSGLELRVGIRVRVRARVRKFMI